MTRFTQNSGPLWLTIFILLYLLQVSTCCGPNKEMDKKDGIPTEEEAAVIPSLIVNEIKPNATDTVTTAETPARLIQRRNKRKSKKPSLRPVPDLIRKLNLLSLICGREQLINQTKFFDGTSYYTHSWPWIAGLYKIALTVKDKVVIPIRESRPFCSATLVGSRYLITAMHCLMGLDSRVPAILPKNKWFKPELYLPYRILVRFGDHYTDEVASVFCDEFIVDSARVFTEGLNFPMTDVAVLKLKTDVTMNEGIAPVCLPNIRTKLPVGTECFAVGLTNFSEPSVFGDRLQEVRMPLRKMEKCQEIVNIARETNHICTEPDESTAVVVNGGGGLYCKIHPDDDRYYLIGVSTPNWYRTGLFASVAPLMSTLVGLATM